MLHIVSEFLTISEAETLCKQLVKAFPSYDVFVDCDPSEDTMYNHFVVIQAR